MNNNNRIPTSNIDTTNNGINMEKTLLIPLFSSHLHIGYRIKLINNAKLKGMKNVLPK
jgi:hypothetical protein